MKLKCLCWRLWTEGQLCCFLECCRLYWMIIHVRPCHVIHHGVDVKLYKGWWFLGSHIIFVKSQQIVSISCPSAAFPSSSSLHISPLSSRDSLLPAGRLRLVLPSAPDLIRLCFRWLCTSQCRALLRQTALTHPCQNACMKQEGRCECQCTPVKLEPVYCCCFWTMHQWKMWIHAKKRFKILQKQSN